MDNMLSLKLEDEKILHPDVLNWFNARRAEIQCDVPLEELTGDDLDAFLTDDEKPEFRRDIDEINKALSASINTDGASPDPFVNAKVGLTILQSELNLWIPMRNIGLLLKKVHQRKVAKAKEEEKQREEEENRKAEEAREEERRKEEEERRQATKAEEEKRGKEEEKRWRAARKAVNPPIDDAKRYLDKPDEYDKFIQAALEAIEVYMEKAEDYLDDSHTFDYRGWLWKINYRKEEARQKIAAKIAAQEYNRELNKEIVKLKSKLDPQKKNLSTYFQAKIKDKRYTGHKFDYVLSKEEAKNFDRTLVRMGNERLEQLIPDSLRQFIDIPSQYYRIYFPLPSTSYIFEGIPCLDFCFEIFAATYAEVWLKPGQKNLGDYIFNLPWREEKGCSVLLREPEFLGYHYLVLTPEDLDGYVFWQTIPLFLLKGLLNGETKPNGATISEALDDSITYKIPKFEEEVEILDIFADYLKNIGSIDQMLTMGIITTEKVVGIVKSELGELKVEHEASPLKDKVERKDTKKAKAFRLFDEGKTPSAREVKALKIKSKTSYNYYQEWKKIIRQ